PPAAETARPYRRHPTEATDCFRSVYGAANVLKRLGREEPLRSSPAPLPRRALAESLVLTPPGMVGKVEVKCRPGKGLAACHKRADVAKSPPGGQHYPRPLI